MIAGVIGYDSIRKHLAECGYHTAEIREKFAESLKVLMKDDKLRAHFTDDSQRNMYQFSKDRIVANWIQLLEELTE